MAAKTSLTILFENPFWIGLFERTGEGRYEVCNLLLYNWDKLQFSPPVKTEKDGERRINPKRMHRKISRQLKDKGIGTKAQQALKLQHEQNKTERKTKNRAQKETGEKRQYTLRQEKKKAKHKGQ